MENSVTIHVKDNITSEVIVCNTLITTKISEFFNLLTSKDSIVIGLIIEDYDFIDLSLFFDKAMDSYTTRFKYDLFQLSPKYFEVKPIVISVIEEQGETIFNKEMRKYEKQFMDVFNANSLFIGEQQFQIAIDRTTMPFLKISYFFDSEEAKIVLDYVFENSNAESSIKDFHEKSNQISIILNEIINNISN